MEPAMIVFSFVMTGLIVILFLGFVLLAFIRYVLKDKQLSKNIIHTVIVSASIPLSYKFLRFIHDLIYTVIYYPERMQPTTWRSFLEQMLEAAAETLILMIPVLATGFLIAFLIVVPITLRSRRINR